MKKCKKLWALFITVLMIISVSMPVSDVVSQSKTRGIDIYTEQPYVQGEAIVRLKRSLKSGRAAGGISMETLFTFPTTEVSSQEDINSYSLEPSPVIALARSESLSTEEMILKLQEDPNVEYAEPNYIRKIDLPDFDTYSGSGNSSGNLDVTNPKEKLDTENTLDSLIQGGVNTFGNANSTPLTNDLDLGYLWFMNEDLTQTPGAIGVDSIWKAGKTGDKNVIVAVLDTGIDVNHPDLKDNVNTSLSYNALDGSNNIADGNGHGTHVSGTIGAVGNNKEGISGVNQNVTIMGVKVVTNDGQLSVDSDIRGLSYVLEKKTKDNLNIKAVNMSYGKSNIAKSEIEVVRALGNAGVTVVIASGNSSANSDLIALSESGSLGKNIITVNAVGSDGKLAKFSNYGEANTQICAPGVRILSTFPPSMASMGDINKASLKKDDFLLYPTGGGFGMTATSGSVLTNNGNNLVWNIQAENAGVSTIFNKNPLDLRTRDISKPVYITFPLKDITTSVAGQGVFQLGASIKSSSGEWISKEKKIVDLNNVHNSISVKIQPDEDINWEQLEFKFSVIVLKEGPYGNLELTLEKGIATNEGFSYAFADGTSMAAPIVAGSVALLSTVYPNETSEQIAARIVGGAEKTEDLKGMCVSGGRLNFNGTSDPVPVIWEIEESQDSLSLIGNFFGAQGTLNLDEKQVSVLEWKDDKIIFSKDPQMLAGLHRLTVADDVTGKIGNRILDLPGKMSGEYDVLPAIDYKKLGFDTNLKIRSMVATNGNIYVLSMSGKDEIALLRYSINDRSWSVEPNIVFEDQMPLTMAVIGQYIYFLTTSQKGNLNYEIMLYDTVNKNLSHQKTVYATKEIQEGTTYWAENEYFYAAGGNDYKWNSMPSAFKIAVRSGTLEVLPDMKTARRYPTGISDGSQIAVFGGYGNQSYKMVLGGEYFDGTNWIESGAPQMYEDQEPYFALGRVSNGYFLAGAQYEKEDLRNLWKYDSASHKWISLDRQLGISKLKIPISTTYEGKFYVHAVKDVAAKAENVFYSMDADTGKVPYSIITEGDAFGTIILPETAKFGEYLTVKDYPQPGYELDTIYLNGSLISSKEFNMPSQSCFVTASFRPIMN